MFCVFNCSSKQNLICTWNIYKITSEILVTVKFRNKNGHGDNE